MDNAFGWIKSNGGLCTEDDYPYTSGSGSSGSCKTSCSKAATLTGWSDVKQGDEDALKSAVEKGPVSVAIEADKSVFQLYSGGVFTSAEQCGTQLDHGVLVVGYGKCVRASLFLFTSYSLVLLTQVLTEVTITGRSRTPGVHPGVKRVTSE